MAVTKKLARNSGLKAAMEYVLSGDKTQEQILTVHLNCDPGHEYQQMMDAKQELGKLDGRQCYHISRYVSSGHRQPRCGLLWAYHRDGDKLTAETTDLYVGRRGGNGNERKMQ